MRSRHTYAILRLMEAEETVAKDLEDYVRISVRLALDERWRIHITSQILANKFRVYNDLEAVRGLERFLAKVVLQGGASDSTCEAKPTT